MADSPANHYASLLPRNRTSLMASMEQANRHQLPADFTTLWNAAHCPVAFLPYLAWAVSVDEWDADWSETTKRNVIAASLTVHRHKGTVGAMQLAVDAIGAGLQVQEWYEYSGQPYTFRIIIDDAENFDEDEIAEIVRVVKATKNLRSQFEGIFSSQELKLTANTLAAPQSITASTVYPLPPLDQTVNLSAHSLLYIAAPTYSTVYPADFTPVGFRRYSINVEPANVSAAPTTRRTATVFEQEVSAEPIPIDTITEPLPPEVAEVVEPAAAPVVSTASGIFGLFGALFAGLFGL